MAQTAALLNALKRALRAQGKTYADVAITLGLSVASVKRLFAERSLSLERLDSTCTMLNLEVSDLLRQLDEDDRHLTQLSQEQERVIASDRLLLLVAVSVLNRLTADDILARFHIDRHQCIRKLAWLDRQGFIDLLPKDRIKLRVAANFAWLPDGPIQRFFQEKLSAEYFKGRFAGAHERLHFLTGMLSAASQQQFQRKLDRLAQEFEEMNQEDGHLPTDERPGYTVVLAVRPWIFGAFSEYIRD